MRNLARYVVLLALALLIAVPAAVLATGDYDLIWWTVAGGEHPYSTGGGYDLSWWTVDGGGHTFSTGGGYSLGGTIGQPDAGAMSDGTGTFVLSGGFWNTGVLPVTSRVYLPLVVRNH